MEYDDMYPELDSVCRCGYQDCCGECQDERQGQSLLMQAAKAGLTSKELMGIVEGGFWSHNV